MNRDLISVYGGEIVELRDGDGVRSVVLPSNIPPERALLIQRAAKWADETIYRWLLTPRFYNVAEPVVLSFAHVIHLPGAPFKCGTRPEGKDGSTPLSLREALAEWIDDEGKRHNPTPCAACFASGLLVIGWEEAQ